MKYNRDREDYFGDSKYTESRHLDGESHHSDSRRRGDSTSLMDISNQTTEAVPVREKRSSDGHEDYSRGSENHNGQKNRSRKKSRRSKKSNIVFIIVIVVAACVLIFAAYKLISISSGYKKAADTYEVIADMFQQKEEKTTKKADTKETTTEAPFIWDYDALLAVNPESVGWIRNGFLNYPIVHSTDEDGNEKYLYTLINGESNSCGTLFVDKNIPSGLDGMYSIVYGHNMDDGSMFGGLHGYNDVNFYNAYPEMDLYIGYNHYIYKVFAAFTTPVDSFVYTYSLDNEDDFNNFVANARSMNSYEMYSGSITYGVNNIITLSTCTSNDDPNYRYVVVLCRDHLVGD